MPEKKTFLPLIVIIAFLFTLLTISERSSIAEEPGGLETAVSVEAAGTAGMSEPAATEDTTAKTDDEEGSGEAAKNISAQTSDLQQEQVSPDMGETGASMEGTTEEAAETAESADEQYEPGFYYTVKKGDTLWGLSKKFYDSEWEWPAMWGQNKDIRNPHLIYPGQRIRLYQKAPQIEAKDKETEKPQQTLPLPPPQEEEEVAPPQEEQPVVASAPPAEEEEKLAVYYSYPPISKVGFVEKLSTKGFLTKKYVDPYKIGEIFKVEGDQRVLLAQGDVLYIKPTGAEPYIIGNTYYIYKAPTPVTHPVTGDYAGHQFLIAGIAEVTATPGGYVVAKITHSFREISVGDRVMTLKKRSPKLEVKNAPSNIEGVILCSEDRNEMFGDNSIVFLDKGARDGIEPGQMLEIFYTQSGKLDGNEVPLQPVVYGSMLVLLAKDTTATAIITRCYRHVHPGAYFRTAAAE